MILIKPLLNVILTILLAGWITSLQKDPSLLGTTSGGYRGGHSAVPQLAWAAWTCRLAVEWQQPVPGIAAAKHRALHRREGGGECSWQAKAGFDKGPGLLEGMRAFRGAGGIKHSTVVFQVCQVFPGC